MQQPLFEIRDQRQKEWFWMDNEFMNGMAKLVGPIGTLVYMALCRHSSNDTQSCFPSMEMIADETGLKSRKTVSKGIKILEAYCVIEIHERYDSVKRRRMNNIYVLMNRSLWKKEKQVEKEQPIVVAKQPLRLDLKKKFTAEGAMVIKAFEVVDAKNKTYYGNKSQREACEFLIQEYGLEKVIERIGVLPRTNKVLYFPKINSPWDLKEKWVKLEDAVASKGEEIKNKSKLAFA